MNAAKRKLIKAEQLKALQLSREIKATEAERRARLQESVNIFVPTDIQRQILESDARRLIVSGGNRGGKTIIIAMWLALVALGRHSVPRFNRPNLRIYVVGASAGHLGEVLYRKVFKPGAFKVIKDKKTGLMRAFNRQNPEDLARALEADESEPLIPSRYIEDTSWRLKKDACPLMVRLKNGTEIRYHTGEGLPAQGFDADVVIFDEEIQNIDWFVEAIRGLIDREGTFVWGATPQAATTQFLQLLDKADHNQIGLKVAKFVLRTKDNPHLAADATDDYASLLDEEERLVRMEGLPAVGSFLMFPFFSMDVLGIDMPNGIPDNWTRYVAIDPGYGVTAAVFCAVPPPGNQNIMVVYDELYCPKHLVWDFAQRMADKSYGQYFQRFIIDEQQGAKHDQYSGKSVHEQFSEAFRKAHVSSQETGYGFTAGFSDKAAGAALVRESMRVRPGEGSRMRILRGTCPGLVQTLGRLRRKRKKGDRGQWIYLDEHEEKSDCHLYDCLRYLCGAEPLLWCQPGKKIAPLPWAVERFNAKMKRQDTLAPAIILGPQRRAS